MNEACAGILNGATTQPNGVSLNNTYYNVVNTTLAGDTCATSEQSQDVPRAQTEGSGVRSQAAQP